MKNSNSVVEDAPGADSPVVKVPDLDAIEKWIAKDISMCVAFLNALHTDEGLRKQMAVWIQGRYSNSLHKPDPSQIKLGL